MKKLADWIVDKKGLIFLFVAVLTVAAVLGIFKTNINYDMSKYLPSDSSVKQGMEESDGRGIWRYVSDNSHVWRFVGKGADRAENGTGKFGTCEKCNLFAG